MQREDAAPETKGEHMQREVVTISPERANYIQGEWMALDPFAPDAERQRVFRLLAELPTSYFAINDQVEAQAFYKAAPMHGRTMPVAEAKLFFPEVQTAIAWHTTRAAWVRLDA